ncbi:MAG: ABC transporter substrate-binding protein [Deltaproteobacteria bacterium]|nr:ABC transporter substrate-binding protein [Deltaproteobacteria bacterium]
MNVMRRAGFLVLLPVLVLATAAQSAERVKMTIAVESLAFFPLYVARGLEYFREEGLELEVISTGGGGPDVQALIAGNVEFTIAAGTYQISAYQEGRPLLGVFSLLNRNIINLVLHREVARQRGVTPESPLAQKLRALKGLTIGITRPGALTDQVARYHLHRAGLDPARDVRIIGAGAGPALVAALEQRKIDVLVQSTPVPETAVRRGLAIMLVNNSAGEDPALAEFMMELLLVRPDYARQQADTVRRAVRALHRANRWIREQTAEAAQKVIQRYFAKTPPETLLGGIRSVREAVSRDGLVSERALRITLEVIEETGQLKRRPTLAEVFTPEFLPR